jgi:integrase/recombinase XerD
MKRKPVGRPAMDTDVVFLRHTAPLGPMKPTTLHSIVTQYLGRAGIAIPWGKKHGPHALRHSLASAMLQHEAPLPVISAALGHSDSTTTAIYLTIDVTQLRVMARPVPPVRAGLGGIFA